MRAISSFGLGIVTIALAACASTPPQELHDAHDAVDRVAHGNAATVVPADVHEAQTALSRADQSFDKTGDSQETRDLA